MINMKTFEQLLLIFTSIAISFSLQAQNGEEDYDYYLNKENKPVLEHEIGLNVSQFINQFISTNNEPIFFQPYLLTYKSTTDRKTFFRSGYGFNFDGNSEKPDVGEPKATNYLLSINIRLGVEKQWNVGNKWLMTYGLDFPIDFNYSSTNSISQFQDVRLKSTRVAAGLGPVIGFHYKINEKVKIGTESTLYMKVYTIRSNTSVDGSELDKSQRDGITTSLTSPISIYFSMTI